MLTQSFGTAKQHTVEPDNLPSQAEKTNALFYHIMAFMTQYTFLISPVWALKNLFFKFSTFLACYLECQYLYLWLVRFYVGNPWFTKSWDSDEMHQRLPNYNAITLRLLFPWNAMSTTSTTPKTKRRGGFLTHKAEEQAEEDIPIRRQDPTYNSGH